ncbi:MAG: Mu transposase C-terminal domain-containing protein [Clostridia bacterium]|nr:Mu transposase C-terminal domain-containing protein [Clostridia bacterium]
MKKNDLIKTDSGIFRILSINGNNVLAIDCKKKTMPQFFSYDFFNDGKTLNSISSDYFDFDELSPADRKIAQQRYTMIASAITVLDDVKQRNLMIEKSAAQFGVSKQTLRTYLCTYLVYQDIAALAPKHSKEKELTQDQKNMKWALNKFFYTRNKNSLSTAYTMMLKAKYCDDYSVLLPEYPSFNQFRYFYRKHRKMENFFISRDGIKDYQMNNRPLLGDGVQEFAPSVGTAMLDGTICDIYLVNECGQLIGRPVLVVACDANTSMCLGYSLLWQGGTYSLQNLMLNILEDKVALCERMGIHITADQWAVNQLPGIMVTDGGSEYKGKTFEQIAELGVSLITLPPYRPELKGQVEKLFDLVQSSYKNVLKGKGVIMPDFQERGSHDYRKDAVLTLEEFERIVVRCIVHYNSERVIKSYPYTPEMLEDNIKPYANEIWNWKVENDMGTNLISVSIKELILTLLPRTNGKFTKYGLKVNRLRYHAEGYKERYLQGGDVIVAYNPDNCNKVWLIEKDGSFIAFSLIESRFENMSLDSVQDIQQKQKEIMKDTIRDNYQAKIELMSFIESVASKPTSSDVQIKDTRAARKSATRKQHKNIGGVIDE